MTRQATPAAARHKNAQTILRFNRTVNGFGFEHGLIDAPAEDFVSYLSLRSCSGS
jgi:hypothetical protein